MAAIAYITDQGMIEFHRLNGNTNIIFWRPTSQKNFSNFTYGDYLFFLAKGTEKGLNKEKGIIGYGKFTKDYDLGFKEMWRKFKTKNGYASEKQLHDAIIKTSKKGSLPKRIQCLELNDVVFFQTPIYLSELGISISKQIESYTYIDQDTLFTSSKIIQKASSYGKDMWSAMILNRNDSFKDDADILLLRNINQKYSNEEYNDYEKSKYLQFTKKFMSDESFQYMDASSLDFFHRTDEKTRFYIPCLLSMQSSYKRIFYYIGKYNSYVSVLQSIDSFSDVYLLFDREVDDDTKMILINMNVLYICLNNIDICS